MSDQAKLTNVRLSFPDLWKPKAVQEGGEEKYGCSLLLDKEDNATAIKELKALITAVAEAKWGEKLPGLVKAKKIKFCLHQGSEKTYDGYEGSETYKGAGNMYVSTSSSKFPLIIDRDRSPLQEKDGRPYAGCYVNAIIRLWAQDNQFGKRINAELKGVQFFKDGEAFGADAPASVDDFDDLSEGDGEEKKTEAAKEKKAPAKKAPSEEESESGEIDF